MGRRGGLDGAAEARLHPEVAGGRALEHRVGERGIDEDQRPLAPALDLLDEGLDHNRAADLPGPERRRHLGHRLVRDEAGVVRRGPELGLHDHRAPAMPRHHRLESIRCPGLQDHGGHGGHAGRLQGGQVALAQVPADQVGRVPDARPRALEAVEPGPEPLGVEVVLPVGAQHHRVEAVEVGARHVPRSGLHHRPAALERPLRQPVALRDLRPAPAGHEADARHGARRRLYLQFSAVRRLARLACISSM